MLYFFPKIKSLKAAIAANPWLPDLCPSAQTRETSRGPADAAGLLVAAGGVATSDVTYDTRVQTWQKRFGSDAWLGFPTATPPGPAALARDGQVPGESLILLDGNAWMIPRLVAYDADQLDGPIQYGCLVDRVLQQDPETGRMVPGAVTPPYRAVWDAAIKIGDNLLSQITGGKTSAELPDDALESFVSQLLGLNYRLDTPEISALGLLSASASRRIVQIGVDWQTLETNLKNRLSRPVSGGTNTESGDTPQTEVCSIPTDPQSPN